MTKKYHTVYLIKYTVMQLQPCPIIFKQKKRLSNG